LEPSGPHRACYGTPLHLPPEPSSHRNRGSLVVSQNLSPLKYRCLFYGVPEHGSSTFSRETPPYFFLTAGRRTSEDADLCDVSASETSTVLHACKFCISRDMKMASWPSDRRRASVARHTVLRELVADPHTHSLTATSQPACAVPFQHQDISSLPSRRGALLSVA